MSEPLSTRVESRKSLVSFHLICIVCTLFVLCLLSLLLSLVLSLSLSLLTDVCCFTAALINKSR